MSKLLEDHIDLLRKEVDRFLHLGMFVQDWRRAEGDGRWKTRQYTGETFDPCDDVICSSQVFRGWMRQVAKEHKLPFIRASRWMAGRRWNVQMRKWEEFVECAEVVLPQRKVTKLILAPYYLGEMDTPTRSIRPGYSVTTLKLFGCAEWDRFMRRMMTPEVREALKLPPLTPEVTAVAA